MEWEGEDDDGDAWPSTWEPEKNVNAAALHDFNVTRDVLGGLHVNGVDVRPLFSLTRKKLANALNASKMREIASMHDLQLDFLSHEDLCRAFFKLVARPKVLPRVEKKVTVPEVEVLEYEENEDFMQLNITNIKHVAWFCSLENHLGKDRAKGLLRYDMGRAYNSDLQAVGLPLSLTAKKDKNIPGIVAVTLKFPSVHFLGKFGTPEPPPMVQGWLKKEANLENFVNHVRKVLPLAHPLAQAGWTKLPRNVYSLTAAVAMPDA